MRHVFAQNLRTIQVLVEGQTFKFSIKVLNKTTASATQFAKGRPCFTGKLNLVFFHLNPEILP